MFDDKITSMAHITKPDLLMTGTVYDTIISGITSTTGIGKNNSFNSEYTEESIFDENGFFKEDYYEL